MTISCQKKLGIEQLEPRALLTTFYVDSIDGSDSAAGTSEAAAWQSLAKINSQVLAPGDTVLFRRGGDWSGVLEFNAEAGTAQTPVRVGGYGVGDAPLLAEIDVHSGSHHLVVEDLVVDHGKQSGDAIRIRSSQNVVLRNLEVKDGTEDGIEFDQADGLVIDGLHVHHFLAGSFTASAEAHGITGTDTDGVTIRNTEVHHVSGDSVHVDPDGDTDVTTNVLIEDSHFWTSPLQVTFNSGWQAGHRPGENAVETNVVDTGWDSVPRMRIEIRNTVAHGWLADSYVVNKAAFKMKDKVAAIFEGVTVYDNEIGFRLRGTLGNAEVTIQNSVIYNNGKAIRAEDDLANLVVHNSTFGAGNTTPIELAGSSGGTGTWDLRNNAFWGAVPSLASDPSNLVAGASDFFDPARHNYRLTATSTLLDAGVTLASVTTDWSGIQRPQGVAYDVGAFEFLEGANDSPVIVVGDAVYVNGSSANDNAQLTLGSSHSLIFNGITYSFDATDVATFDIQTGAGTDRIQLTGTSANDTAVLRVGQLRFTSAGIHVAADSVESINVTGGGGEDVASFHDSAGDDLFRTWSGIAVLNGPDFNNRVAEFYRTFGYATAGGYDEARMYDSAEDDLYQTRPARASMSGSGYRNVADYFERTRGFAIAGGYDEARMYDSADDNIFQAYSTHVAMSGPGFLNIAERFERSRGFATAGGYDEARFYDTPGDDIYQAWSTHVSLSGAGFLNIAESFERTRAFATAGGYDEARIYDTPGDDIYQAWSTHVSLSGAGFLNIAESFERTRGIATAGGYDEARLYDSAGDDMLQTWPAHAALSGNGFLNIAEKFEKTRGIATGGGYDEARMYDSAGDDLYRTWSTQAVMSSAGSLNYAEKFELTRGFATNGGYDEVRMHDTAGADLFRAWHNLAIMSGAGYRSMAEQFDLQRGFASGGLDEAQLYDSPGDDRVTPFTWGARMQGAAYESRAEAFPVITAYGENGGTNVADTAAIGYSFTLLGDWVSPDTTPPTVPLGLAVSTTTISTIDLLWLASVDLESGVVGYRIYRDGVQVAQVTGLSFTDTDLTPSTDYSYQVSAINAQGMESALSPAVLATTAEAAAEEFVIMDFEDSLLHTTTWLASQPAGTIAAVVQPKSDSGSDSLSIAAGQGINGSNALLVQAPSSSAGLPGFWVLKHRATGGSYDNIYDANGYMLPQGMRANRLEFSFRFEEGFRASHAAQPNQYPYVENLHVGTYHFDPALIGSGSSVVESNNWHFYHQLWVRHDKAGDGWIKVVLNMTPHHQRSVNNTPVPPNPTAAAGDYWELLTRFYIDPVPYFANPEIPYPVKMWVDDIKLTYVPEPTDVAVKIENYDNGAGVSVPEGTTRSFQVTLTNATGAPITGVVSSTTPYWLRPALLDAATGQPLPKTITLAAGETRQVIMRLSPDVTGNPGTYNAGVVFVPEDQFTTNNAGLESPLVEQRLWADVGPPDATTYSAFLKVSTSASPLRAADGAGFQEFSEDALLTHEVAQDLSYQTIGHLADAGLSDSIAAQLSNVELLVMDLSGAGSDYLAVTHGNTIFVDDDAAGYGWSALGSGSMDLISVLLHEYGHVLGREHSDDPEDVLHELLAPGERWDAFAAAVDELMATELD